MMAAKGSTQLRLRLMHTVLLALICFLVPNTVRSSAAALAREWRTTPQWQGPLLEGPVNKLLVFADGTLLSERDNDVQQSTDGGQTWNSVPLPLSAMARFVGADPNDETVLFATGAAPLYKSTDGGATWHVVITDSQLDELKRDSEVSGEPITEAQRFRAMAVAESPADHQHVYAELAWNIGNQFSYPPYGLYSSGDGGETWTPRQKVGYGTLCTVRVLLLMPHPTTPGRLFRDTDCLAGRNFGSTLTQSTDDGQTFQPFWDESKVLQNLSSVCRGMESTYGFPRALVGGAGAAAARWYLAVNRDTRFGGSTLLRTDDDGASWQPFLTYRGGGQAGCTEPGDWNIQIAGVAYDPGNPDRVYVARVAHDPHADFTQPPDYVYPVVTSGTTLSNDAGETWEDIGSQQMGFVTDLVLSPDAATLFLATDQGVWRLDLFDTP